MPTVNTQHRPMNIFHRLVERFAYTRAGTWLILNVASRLDPQVNQLTGGRVSVASLIGLPLVLLTTTGAKTGLQRTVALVFFSKGDNIILIASNGGKAKHPAWYHNLRAHPQAQLYIRGKSQTCVAREAEGDEREVLWAEAVRVYAGYEAYQQRARDRRIPVMVLSPQTSESQ